jgi:ABC-type antimicrobial peptide transport system permease subunit
MVMEAKTMEEHVGVMLFPARMAALLLGFFGVVALVLATIGLYGVVSFAVSRRTREVGIRMSLGADRSAVIGMVLRGALGVVLVGGLAGLVIAIGLAQLIRQFLFGIGPADPLTLVGVPLLLGGVAALAAYVPGRRASRVDPVEALRHE